MKQRRSEPVSRFSIDTFHHSFKLLLMSQEKQEKSFSAEIPPFQTRGPPGRRRCRRRGSTNHGTQRGPSTRTFLFLFNS
jgi:hypothetical protein